MESLLTGGILSFDAKIAELATTNSANFQAFVPHGLQLHRF